MNWSRRVGAVIVIFAGAALGAALLVHVGLYAPLALAETVILSGTLAFASHLPAGYST